MRADRHGGAVVPCRDDRCSAQRGAAGPGKAAARSGHAAEQASGKAAQRLLPVLVVRVEPGEEGEREALATRAIERHLMVDEARARAPASLEVEVPAAVRNASDTPALGRDDGREEVHRVAAVSRRHEAVDRVEEERLASGGDLGLAPDRPMQPKVLHAGGLRERVEPRFADEADHPRGGGVVRPLDHRPEQVALPLLEVAAADIRAAEVGDEQHRLQHARRRRDGAGVITVQPAGLVHHRERDRPGARLRVALRGCHARLPGRGRGGVGGRRHDRSRDGHGDREARGGDARVSHCRTLR